MYHVSVFSSKARRPMLRRSSFSMATRERSCRFPGSQREAGLRVMLLWVILSCALSAIASGGGTTGRREVVYSSPDGFRIYATYCQPAAPSDRAVIIFPDGKEGRGRWDSIA